MVWQNGICKHCRPRSDCSFRSLLCLHSTKHFKNQLHKTQYLDQWSVLNFRTFTVKIVGWVADSADHYIRCHILTSDLSLHCLLRPVCLIAQSVTHQTADPRVPKSNPSSPTTFMETDREIISLIIRPFHWFKKGSCQLQALVCVKVLGNRLKN